MALDAKPTKPTNKHITKGSIAAHEKADDKDTDGVDDDTTAQVSAEIGAN